MSGAEGGLGCDFKFYDKEAGCEVCGLGGEVKEEDYGSQR